MLAVFVESKIWINTLEEEINFQQLNQDPDKHGWLLQIEIKKILDKIFYKLNLKARIHSSNSNLVCILIFVLFCFVYVVWCGKTRKVPSQY